MIQDDFSIDYVAKTITHTSGTTVYTVNELYSWLMDTFDELAQMDNDVPMSAQTPTEYTLINGWSIPDLSYRFLKGGAINDTTNNNLWANVYTLGSIEVGTQLYVLQNGAIVTSYWPSGHMDILIKVKSGGVLIDSGNITVFARELSDTYDYFDITLSSGGRNAVPIATANDLNNQTASGTIAGWNDITVTFGTVSRNLNNGNGAKNYDVEINCAGRTLDKVYEYLKYITRRGATGTLNSIQGQFYKDANGAYTAVKQAPFGTFAGGTFFGARGVWLTNYAADQSFQLIAADGTTQIPPNIVYIQVTGLVSGDRVGVYRLTGAGGTINKAQYTVQSTTSNSVTMTGAIASDTPSAGYLRIGDELFNYTGWSGSAFSGVSPSPAGKTGSAYVPLIDAQAAGASINNNLIYSADIPVLIRVRKKGILPFEIEGTISASGLSQAAIRTTDTIVT